MRVFIVLLSFMLLALPAYCQDSTSVHYDRSQFPLGFPDAATNSALQQLQSYPQPRYYPNNKLQRLFNWMDPTYAGGRWNPAIKKPELIQNTVDIQRELALHWNYGINLLMATYAFQFNMKGDSVSPFVRLADQYPNITADVITSWMSVSPKVIGRNIRKSYIMNGLADSTKYSRVVLSGRTYKVPKFNFPDSLIYLDGEAQKYYLQKLCKYLTRPINRINENGEEPPNPSLNVFKSDPDMVHMKDSMKIDSWEDFMATCKYNFRSRYSSAFMNEIPELKNTQLSFYIVEGGPIDRFKWHIMKKIQTPINGIYYSTPDFYTRWPKNWKNWVGAWHGWKWIDMGRKVEIADGDYLFSPFVGAGWDYNPRKDIRPAQWLGLLKCLSVVGAEFYYVGYFNLKAPFSNPADYIWQAAMPAYAQAVTSRFEDALRNGNVLFDKKNVPIITYPINNDDGHMLVAVRKHNTKQQYIIACTYQPFENDSGVTPAQAVVSINIAGRTIKFNARRQGSVYVYEIVTGGRQVFYQLDTWHENAHPERWSKDFQFEAEVADTAIDENSIFTQSLIPLKDTGEGDLTHFVSFVRLQPRTKYVYNFTLRDSSSNSMPITLTYKGKGKINVTISGAGQSKTNEINLLPAAGWTNVQSNLHTTYKPGDYRVTITSESGNVDLDKFVIKGAAR